MRKLTAIFTLLGLLFTSQLFSQAKPEWKNIFSEINQEVQNNSKAYSSLQRATETIGHRLTGSENGKKAEQFAYDLLKSYGFKDVRFQPFEVESWSRGTLAVTIGTGENDQQSLKSVTLAHSPVKSDVLLEVVDMGNGLEEDYATEAQKAKINGKIALVYLGVLPGSKEGPNHCTAQKKRPSQQNTAQKGSLSCEYGRWRYFIDRNRICNR
jgi:hypothetical protein